MFILTFLFFFQLLTSVIFISFLPSAPCLYFDKSSCIFLSLLCLSLCPTSGLPPLLTLLLLCCFFFLLRSSVLECRQRLRGSTSPWRRVKGRIFQRSLASGKQEDNNKKPFSLQKLHLTPGSVMFSVNEEIPWKCKVKMSSLFGKRVFSQAQ